MTADSTPMRPGAGPHLPVDAAYPDPAMFRTELVLRAAEYWYGRRTGCRLPARADIRPEEILQILPHVFLVDVSYRPLAFKFRLIGTEIDRLAARSYTGAGVNEAEYARGWRRIHEQYQSVVETRAPRLEINDAVWTGREFITYERFIAPLSTDGAVIDALFGALYPV